MRDCEECAFAVVFNRSRVVCLRSVDDGGNGGTGGGQSKSSGSVKRPTRFLFLSSPLELRLVISEPKFSVRVGPVYSYRK